MDFVGRKGSAVLFSSENVAVIVDESTNTVLETGDLSSLSESTEWDSSGDYPSSVSSELAVAAIADLDIRVFSNNDRLYTIPKAVEAEARRGLEWHKQEGRGGTSVGMNTARTLAKGGQIGLRKVRHIAKYFPRHEVDKKGKGYKPGQEGYPSNGRIAWALWGGDAGKRWASAIVEREDAKSASSFELYEDFTPIEVNSFVASADLESGTEFYIRLFADGSGFDRLYSSDEDGVLSVWERGAWYDLGESYTSFSAIDSVLDEELLTDFVHVPVDSDAALVASAILDTSTTGKVFIAQIDEEEALLAASAIEEIDFKEIDSIMAAGFTGYQSGQSGYTSAERSQNASEQVRDATGKFAKSGSHVSVKSANGGTGVITAVDPASKTVTVKMDSGNTVQVPATDTQPDTGTTAPARKFTGAPLDVTGILGEPRNSANPALAMLDNRLPPLTADDINALMADWPAWVADQRSKVTQTPIPQVHVEDAKEGMRAPNAYNDPYLRKWLDKKVTGKDGTSSHPNRSWYNPVRTDAVDKKLPASQVKRFSTAESDLFTATLLAAAGKALTPSTSDVPPVYMAVVAQDDPQAVMDLICLIPASSTSTEPAVYSFNRKTWELDPGMLRDLKSPTPPPVVVLDDKNLKDVLGQMTSNVKQDATKNQTNQEAPVTASIIDEVLTFFWSEESGMLSVTAAGGLDRNRGNAEKLRRYWTVGRGGLKIRWNSGGDWTRCVRHLSKYLGPRARGYCALRHKEMTGLWTGDKAHRQMYGRKGKGVFAMSDEMILSEDKIIDNASYRAQMSEIKSRVMTASGGFQAPVENLSTGAKFIIPVVVPEGTETGDGRKFSKGAITMRDLPLPLMWQIKTDEGHYGSVVVGRIDHMERTDDGIGNAYGVFDNGEYGREAERLVRGGFLRGISADLDKFEAAEEEDLESEDKSDAKKSSGKIIISKARVMGVTLVPKPAFQECSIKLVEEPVVMADSEQDALVACASVVASIPVVPPREWFNDPKLSGPTPLTVSDDGRVFGHIAAWHVDHIGLAMGTKPPRSKSGYSYFHTGVLRCEDGSDVPVGQLTLAGGHASLSADARAAAKHYDDTGSAFADVHAGEDAYGIWVAGSLRPEVTAQQVRAIRASAPSGDWRPIQGNLELVAVCQVNVPGFPIARARVASGQMYALVAAGASYLARLKDDPVYLLQVAEDVKARFASLKSDIALTAGLGGCGCCPACSANCTGSCCANCKINHKVGNEMHKENEPLTVEVLERLLSDVVSFNYRVWGFHWNVTGEDFEQYHSLFGQIQEDVEGSIDPIAENVRKLGGFPPISLTEYVENSTIGQPTVVGGDPKVLVADLLGANQVIIEELKAAFTVFDQANEQAIANFIADRLDMHQKWAWQLASSITEGEIVLSENEDSAGVFEAVFANLVDGNLVAVTEPYGDFAYISQKVREKAAEKGEALPDGSFPIRNVSDLKNAIHAYGRAKPAKRAAVRKHIMKRAKALGKPELIPDTFSSNDIEVEELTAVRLELSARVHGMTAAAPVSPAAVPGEVGVDTAAPKVQ